MKKLLIIAGLTVLSGLPVQAYTGYEQQEILNQQQAVAQQQQQTQIMQQEQQQMQAQQAQQNWQQLQQNRIQPYQPTQPNYSSAPRY